MIRQLLKKCTHCSIHCNRHGNKHCRKGRNGEKGRHLADAMLLEGCRIIRSWFYLGFSKVFGNLQLMIQQYLLKASVNRFQELVWSSKHLLQPVSAVGGTWVIRQLLKKCTHCSIHCNRHGNKHCRKGRNGEKGRHLADAMLLEGCRIIRLWFYLGFSKVFLEPPADDSAVFAEGIR